MVIFFIRISKMAVSFFREEIMIVNQLEKIYVDLIPLFVVSYNRLNFTRAGHIDQKHIVRKFLFISYQKHFLLGVLQGLSYPCS